MHNEGINPAFEVVEEELNKAYLAGCLDSSGTVSAHVSKDEDYALRYTVDLRVRVTRKDSRIIQKLDDFCIRNGIRDSVSQSEGSFKFKIKTARDILRFLEKLQPYFIQRDREVEILLEEIIPAIQKDDYRTDKESFVEVVESVDELKEECNSKGRDHKYDREYFREAWGV